VVERRDRVRLALEPGERFAVDREGLGQHFHRDLPVQLRVARAVDLAHAARAERGQDLVCAEACAGRESQELP